ncbi:hypothetical protein GGR50DRAFT_697903 [Xylaria sp. CBS 124048]|nr:hypothetical protein GGR50DRAFT_697903 [Xylaria sp. CBS 124048]
MSKLIFVFPVLVLALIAIAIYIQVTSNVLSLPISTVTTVLTIIIPFCTAALVVYTPALNRLAGSSTTRQFVSPALQILHGGLALVLATLAAQGFTPGRDLDCRLEGNWQQFWHVHDGRSIERIQNAFECCGLRSVVDRAWPPQHCVDIYNRHSSCITPWRESMMRTSGLQFTVAVLVGLIQSQGANREKLAHLAYLRHRSMRAGGAQDYKQLPRHASTGDNERFIENVEEPYNDGDETEDGHGPDASRRSLPPAGDSAAPHRVEPSGLGRDETNEWRS